MKNKTYILLEQDREIIHSLVSYYIRERVWKKIRDPLYTPIIMNVQEIIDEHLLNYDINEELIKSNRNK